MREKKKANSILSRFLTNTSGNFAVIFALSVTSLAAVAGAAVDYSRLYQQETNLQDAMDIALLGAMRQRHTPESQIEHAYELFEANFHGSVAKLSSIDIKHDGSNKLIGNASATMQTSIMSALGVDQMALNIESVAIRGAQTGYPLCIMAMHPYRKHTLELKGRVSLYGTDCHIYGNSNHVDDVVDPHTKHNYITAASVTAVGYGHHYLQNVTPPLEGSTAVIADPYLSMAYPSFGTCDHYDKEIDGETVALEPGTYCGGLFIKGKSKVTLNPGLYVIQGNAFEIKDSQINGTGVTLYFADRNVEFKAKDAVVRLVAPPSGPRSSFVILARRESNSWEFEDSTLDLYGIVYAPNSDVYWENTGIPNITAEWTAWITDGFSWAGDGTINFPYKTANSTVPHPSSLNVIPRPSLDEVVRLVK